MRIYLQKKFDNSSVSLDVDAHCTVGPVVKASFGGGRIPSGSKTISSKVILGQATGALAQAAANVLSDFWLSSEGRAALEHFAWLIAQSSMSTPSAHGGRLALCIDAGASLEEMVCEFCRFFLLKALSRDLSCPKPVVENASKRMRTDAAGAGQFFPPMAIEEVWQQLLLFPRAYQRMCEALLGKGDLFDYDPCAGARPEHATWRDTCYSATYKQYLHIFQEPPLEGVWEFPNGWVSDPELCEKSLKASIHDKEGIPIDRMRLTFQGVELEDEQRLSECGVKAKSTVSLELR